MSNQATPGAPEPDGASAPPPESASEQDLEVARRIAEAATRANAEAQARRQKQADTQLPPELGGPKGPEPTRYGDWERKGIVSDF